jgi:hypothetical protein
MSNIRNDPKMQSAFRLMIEQANVSCIIETGTNDGTSTIEFAKMVKRVVTIEKSAELCAIAKPRLEGLGNVELWEGSSSELLGKVIWRHGHEEVLFVLDAHWEKDWPLLQELQTINALRNSMPWKCTVVVDDFFVPDLPQFAGCYGGLKGDDSKGREHELVRCGYNEPFKAELDKFPHFWYPIYPEGGIGYAIFSDFYLQLGDNFELQRFGMCLKR